MACKTCHGFGAVIESGARIRCPNPDCDIVSLSGLVYCAACNRLIDRCVAIVAGCEGCGGVSSCPPRLSQWKLTRFDVEMLTGVGIQAT